MSAYLYGHWYQNFDELTLIFRLFYTDTCRNVKESNVDFGFI